jgi:hypothetical protein
MALFPFFDEMPPLKAPHPKELFNAILVEKKSRVPGIMLSKFTR